GADTLLQWDQNGTAAGGEGWRTVITLSNTQADTLTLDNFAPATSINVVEVVNLNAPPVLSAPLTDQSASEDTTFNFTLPANAFVDPNPGDTLTYRARLADGTVLPVWLSFDSATRTFTGTPGNAEVGSLDIRVTATDSFNSSVSDVFTLTVANTNDAPTVSNPVTLTNGEEDQSYTLTSAQLLANVSDIDVGDALSVQSVSVVPVDGSVADNGNGTWTFSPAANQNGTINFTVVVSDGTTTVSTSASMSLTPVNDAPTGNVSVSGSALEGQTLTASHTLADADGLGAVSYQWQSSSDGTTWQNLAGATTASLALGSALVGLQVRVLASYTDGTNTLESVASSATAGVTQAPNTAPVLSTPLADQTANEDAAFTFTVPANAFADPNPGDTLSYSARLANGSALPTWLSFDTATRTFTGTPGNAEVGTLDIRVTATDPFNSSVSDVFTLSIANTNDAPTVSSPVTLANGTEEQSYTLTSAQLLANASDVDVGATLSVQSVSVVPADGSVVDNGNGTWTFSPAANRNGTVNFTVVITDGTATVSTAASLNLAPLNDAPTGNVTLSGTALEGQTLTASHTLADADGLGVVSYQWQASSDGSSWSDLAGATTASLALGSALIGLQVRVLASYTDGGNTLETIASSATVGIMQLLNPIDGTDDSDNPLLGTDAADLIRARDGNDVVQARAGDDTVFGEEGDDVLYGEDGDDSLDGGSGYNQLLGGNGNDTLNLGTGASDNSYASGGAGDDLLIANGLANAVAVSLAGDSGSDVYRFDGSANVVLSDYVNTTTSSDANRLELAAGITPDSVTVSGDGTNITLGFASGKTLQLSNQLLAYQASDNPNQYGVQEVRFSDGTVWNRQQLRELAGYFIGSDALDDTINTGDGPQFLYGHGGNDSLTAGEGDDQLFGGHGDDQLAGGDGNDGLYGEDGDDSLDGGSGYNQLLGGNGNDTLNLGTGASDNSYASGGAGDDLLIANGLANAVAVSLAGDSGSDGYRFDGSANVVLSDYVNTTTSSDANRLELAAGITPDSVTVSGDGTNITLGFASGKTLQLSNQLLAYQASDNPNQYGVQEVRFSDGTMWSRQQLRELAGYYIGSDAVDDSISTGAGTQFLFGHGGNDGLTAGAGEDQLYGGFGDDFLQGGEGNDVLFGDDGNDTLDGGSGANQLIGGGGNDTFRFSAAPDATTSNVVSDFTHGADHLSLDSSAFQFNGQPIEAVLANVSATQTEQAGAQLVYNQSNQTLYYDADGAANGNSVAVVTLAGVATLAASDVQLFS
ncbi:cadherin-like domain-containing protein, partial [Pseudomonas asiatica]|uniref:cadherin-like domain-containing protein n=1 Tax=Pseudomonas asiatica TaxID=2219225 RepID=UPI00383BC4ED